MTQQCYHPPSELILNDDGSVYHLGLRGDDVPDLIFTVGDPDRVVDVARHFEKVEWRKSRREFNMVRGALKGGRPAMVLSTGMGTDNIDIVMNELDAAVNVDLETRRDLPEGKRRRLTVIRIGTSAAVDPNLPLGSHLYSTGALSFDGLLNFYEHPFRTVSIDGSPVQPFYVPAAENAVPDIPDLYSGITATFPGFYGPQGRTIRARSTFTDTMNRLASVEVGDGGRHLRVANFEMETAGIYALAHLLGHRAYSFSALQANRSLMTFHREECAGRAAVDGLIRKVLDWAGRGV